MLPTLYKCLWLLFHLLAGLVDFCTNASSFLLSHSQYLYAKAFHASADSACDDQQAIERSKKHLTKIPSHVAVILGDYTPTDNTISKLISWASAAGVRRISLYDYRGDVITQNHREMLQHWREIRGANGKNGLKQDINIDFLHPMQNKMHLSNVCRALCTPGVHAVKSSDVSIALVDRQFNEELQIAADPELAFFFGEICCTYGLSPWQIRLTEFAGIPVRPHIGVESFLNGLYMYSKCEQRFGFTPKLRRNPILSENEKKTSILETSGFRDCHWSPFVKGNVYSLAEEAIKCLDILN